MRKRLFIASFVSTGLLLTQTAIAEINLARQNELLYFIKHDCGSCHGMTLKGGLGPALLPKTLSAKPKSYLVATILEGHPNTAMPPWKSMLSHDEAVWITEQLQNGSLLETKLAKNKEPQDKKSMNKQSMSKQSISRQSQDEQFRSQQ
ncbi:MAG: cytochrome c [Gammaproteobacteria bacterium]|nr:cytochrome c [Gammaproteobacteria bacterium]